MTIKVIMNMKDILPSISAWNICFCYLSKIIHTWTWFVCIHSTSHNWIHTMFEQSPMWLCDYGKSMPTCHCGLTCNFMTQLLKETIFGLSDPWVGSKCFHCMGCLGLWQTVGQALGLCSEGVLYSILYLKWTFFIEFLTLECK